jgi:hypothetical protein
LGDGGALGGNAGERGGATGVTLQGYIRTYVRLATLTQGWRMRKEDA